MFSSVRTSFASNLCKSHPSLRRATGSPLQRFAAIRFQSTEQAHIRDKGYPFPLYYHLLPSDASSSTLIRPPPTQSDGHHVSYAISFLPTFPQDPRQVIGFLKADKNTSAKPKVVPDKFVENDVFSDMLHKVIKEHLVKDTMVESVLQQQLEGIPLPEDIFGSVQIRDGVIQPSTYQRMPSHRIVTINGLFQLSDYLHDKLVHHLKHL
ncbi:hypothetical protein BGZ54_009015 [Gamsiella multidivaricata]|nr:hypothetical protein BGZ54_009015 [Gamsiella multidivaricata]